MAAEDGDHLARRGVPDARGVVLRRGDDARPVGAEGGGTDPILVAAEDGDRLAGRGVPDARGVVVRRRDDARPVGAEGGGIDLFWWPLRTAIALPVAASQTRAVLSSDAVTMRVPSGLKAAELTDSVVAAQGRDRLAGRGVPDARGVVPRRRDDARPVGAEGGGTTGPWWPLRTAIALPVAASQTRAVLSSDAVTMRDPSGLKAAEFDRALVAAENSDRRAGRGVPDACGLVRRRRDDARPVGAEGGGIDAILVAAEDGDRLAGRGVPDARGVVIRRRDDARPVGAEGGGIDAVLVAAEDGDRLAGRGVPDARGRRR